MPNNPLAEVFGYPTNNQSDKAIRNRDNRLCPYNNKVPSCTKSRISDPIGVCSIHHNNEVVITCPIRFRQDWIFTTDASKFFFPPGEKWTSLTEVRIKNEEGRTAGNIDIVLVAYDNDKRVVDFGSVEIQSVYISGNISRPLKHYMEDPQNRFNMDWKNQKQYPRPDYLSSSRKRLAPQLIYKGGILNSWNKKMAVVLQKGFYQTLPELEEVKPEEADLVWLIYDLEKDNTSSTYTLSLHRSVFTKFEPALRQITTPKPGALDNFLEVLQKKLDTQSEPTDATYNEGEIDNATLDDILSIRD